MTSFEDLRLGPETVAALAAEGLETPTPFQEAAVPVVARGRDLLGKVGPGGGALIAYGAPLADRLKGGAGSPVCLILCTGNEQATALARSLSRLCEAAGLRVAALAEAWNLPERADFLFVPADRVRALFDGAVSTEAVRAIVFHDGDGVVATAPADHLEILLSSVPKDCQRIFFGLPFGASLQSLARRATHRAATVPPPAEKADPRPSAELNCVVSSAGRAEVALEVVANLLQEAGVVRHVLVFCASADQAADLGDLLDLHGYASGPPGDASVPVWLCPGEDAAARAVLEDLPGAGQVATLSCTVPAGAKAVAVRHGTGAAAWTVAAPRELRHLQAAASRAGFSVKQTRPERPARVSQRLDELAARVAAVAAAPETLPYSLLVESLLDEFTAVDLAAGALALLDREKAAAREANDDAAAPMAWMRLFVSAGERDSIGPGDLVGAIAGQAEIARNRIGRIEIRESHSVVEVAAPEAKRVIKALNGTTLGERSLRVDYDRPRHSESAKADGRTRPDRPGARPPSRSVGGRDGAAAKGTGGRTRHGGNDERNGGAGRRGGKKKPRKGLRPGKGPPDRRPRG